VFLTGSDFAMTIMPGWDRHPKEGAIIGRILVAFRELEVTLATSVGVAGFRE
jgi:hypothetical protein